MNRIRNAQVGPAPRSLRWSRHEAGDCYEATRGVVRVVVLRQYRRQWVVKIDGLTMSHIFEGPNAAKRYASGASVTL